MMKGKGGAQARHVHALEDAAVEFEWVENHG